MKFRGIQKSFALRLQVTNNLSENKPFLPLLVYTENRI